MNECKLLESFLISHLLLFHTRHIMVKINLIKNICVHAAQLVD